MIKRKLAVPDRSICVGCGCCEDTCPRSAIKVWRGTFAVVDASLCVGCGMCSRKCPAEAISMKERQQA